MSLTDMIKKSWHLATYPLEEFGPIKKIHENLLTKFYSYELATKSVFDTKPYRYLANSRIGEKLPTFKPRTKTIALRTAGKIVTLAGSLSLLAHLGHQGKYTEIVIPHTKPLPDKIKVISYNIAMGDGGPFQWTKSLFKSPLTQYSSKGIEGITQTLIEENVDIACLNEIGISGVRHEHQPQIFSQRTQLNNYIFGSGITFLASYWNPFVGIRHDFLANGNAILTSAEIIDTTHIRSLETFKPATISTFNDWLVGTEGLLHASIKYKDQRINVYCNHFSSREFESFPWIKHERDRTKEARLLAAFISPPAIVAGDFNTTPLPSRTLSFGDDKDKYKNEQSLIIFKQELSKRGLTFEYGLKDMMNPHISKVYDGTYVGRVLVDDLGKPRDGIGRKYERIDYVFVVNKANLPLQLDIINDQIICPRLDSDHCPVVAEIEIKYHKKD